MGKLRLEVNTDIDK